MTDDYENGWRAGVKAAADVLKTADVHPVEAADHWFNAGDALLWMLESGKLEPRDG